MFKAENKNLLQAIMIPFIAIVFGFILGALIMLFFGYSPIDAYNAMLSNVLTNPYFFGEALRQATVLTLTGLGFNMAYQAGFFNIGLSGQLLMGWLFAIWFALLFPDMPRILAVPLFLLVGLAIGALWAGIAGFLRAYFGTNEVIVTIMLNYTALHFSNYMIRNVLATGNRTEIVGENASLALGFLTNLTAGSRLNLGFFLAILCVVLFWFLMKQTTAGFELRAVGLNSDAAEYAGMSTKKNIILAMVLSGALAGLGGAIHGLGTFRNIFVQSALPQEGFDGIAVGLLGLGNPFGTFLSAILLGILNIGAGFMPNGAGVPDELADVIVAGIIFFIGANYIIRRLFARSSKKGGQI